MLHAHTCTHSSVAILTARHSPRRNINSQLNNNSVGSLLHGCDNHIFCNEFPVCGLSKINKNTKRSITPYIHVKLNNYYSIINLFSGVTTTAYLHKLCVIPVEYICCARPRHGLHGVQFRAGAAYLVPPNFCRRRKSAEKIAADAAPIKAAEFVKCGQPPQKVWLPFG